MHRLGRRDGACDACRQPEFSQLDMEMTFMDEEAIMGLAEGLVRAVFQEASTACMPDICVCRNSMSRQPACLR